IFTNEEGNKKVQFRKDGFTFNQLKPYSNWDKFSKEAFKYWNIYKKEILPESIDRIALRYINKIDLPLTDDLNFTEYFLNFPQLPSIFEQGYLSLFHRIKAQCRKGDFIANVVSNFEKPEDNYLPFILDIDVYGLRDFSINENLNEEFLKIRENKNEIFESLITDKTRDLFS
ncbi:MAG: TIGR04255 family protein, partial [Candidatus Paceibacterota bacterium]